MWYEWKSKIHGVGIYISKVLSKGDIIDIAIDNNNKITLFGSKINHSYKPNSILVKKNLFYYIVANQKIQPYTEITVDYDTTPPFIMKAHQYSPPLK
jgi:hypothetical protein